RNQTGQARNSGQSKVASRTNYNLITIYPFGYYTAVALWIRLISVFSTGVTALFFGARIFSVLLVVLSLVLCYAVCRELRMSQRRALLLTAIVGWFPLTSFVSSYV